MAGLRRRGPDQIGFWVDSSVQMAHARLSILGLDERSSEPIENETHVLAFNGEIYNFLDLQRRLQAEGIPVQGSNDALVLLQAWSRWGPAVLRDLHGFWAFVVYDKARRTLTLVRDQFGVKPLYYWVAGGGACVSSLLASLVDVVPERLELDYAALSAYVRYQFTFGEKTFFRHVSKVLPGHCVEIHLGSGEVRDTCYEDIFAPANAEPQTISPEWIRETRDLVRECILESTISDTPYTTCCSGGLDSGLITLIARPEMAYHCNYSDPECNETFYARQVVQGTPIRLFVVNALEDFNLVERLRSIVEDFDEPTIGSVILPLDDLLAQVKRRYKVLLTGTGGDELFSGYVRYQLAMGECYQDSYKLLFARMQLLRSPEERFEFAHRKGDPALYNFYEPEAEAVFRAAYGACRHNGDDLGAMLRFDRRYFLTGLLNIDDKMGGRHSLESRPSLLHQKLVRHMQRLDCRDLMRGPDLKAVLRAVSADLLPKSVLHRTDKMGFTTPVGDFINRNADHIREQIASSPFRHLYNLHKLTFTAESKFSREVFGLLLLDLWLNRYAGPRSGRPEVSRVNTGAVAREP
ncbi:MAG: asparagine synthase (glutamine-hydrolyzing) [Terriglobales bacterium]